MYVHLGRDYVINDRDIIGIFNLETTTVSPRGREFLNYVQRNGAVVSLSDELPQSYVLADAPVDTVYLSELSPSALRRRAVRTLPEGVESALPHGSIDYPPAKRTHWCPPAGSNTISLKY